LTKPYGLCYVDYINQLAYFGGVKVQICKDKLDIILAEQCKTPSSLRSVMSSTTITRIRKGEDISTKTVGKLAKALNVSVAHLLIKQGSCNGTNNNNK
jgi:DNA-binding Xre family transcriptional regulator